jgi:LDH2 family malate/lactate/ureidoglycolate dehydrogenase
MDADSTFLQQILTGELPLDQWHHRQHVRLAYLQLVQNPFAQAVSSTRRCIKAYNAAKNIPETPDRGYNETLTFAWLQIIQSVIEDYGQADDSESFYENNRQLHNPDSIYLFYSRQLLLGNQAKTHFVEPDVTPLPVGHKSRKTKKIHMPETYYIVPREKHDALVKTAYLARGYNEAEANAAARFCGSASYYGIRTHNAIKALHLDDLFGSKVGRWKPGAKIDKLRNRFVASEIWNANYKLGQAVAYEAMDTCMALADKFGVGTVSVDNGTHYLWGGGYVMDAALKGYIAYTNCTSATSEVVPFGGKTPTMGTNPHSWAFPTQEAIGFPIVIDWATSTVAMGRVQQLKREGKMLPPGCAVDAEGKETNDPAKAVALLPFGAHKGYGLGLIDELYAGFIGGSLPQIRGTNLGTEDDKRGSTFFFQVIHPEALRGNNYSKGRTQMENVKAVIEDVLGHGNEKCMLPGQPEAKNGDISKKYGGLLFTKAELEEFHHIADQCKSPRWNIAEFKSVEI